MSCASSTTAKSKGGFLLSDTTAASRLNMPASVIKLPRRQARTDMIENRPENSALLLRQPRFSAQSHDIAIRLPCFQLPRIDDLLPLRQQKVQAEFVATNFSGCCLQEFQHFDLRYDLRLAEVDFIEPPADCVDGMHLQTFAKTRFVADQSPEFRSECIRQGVGKSGEQHSGIGVGAGQKDSPVQGDDRLTCTCRARNPCRAAVILLDQLPLGRMEKDGPLLPRIFEGAFQFFHIVHHAEPALCIGMIKRIGTGGHRLSDLRRNASGQIQQRLGSLAGQMVGQLQQGILIGDARTSPSHSSGTP